MAADFFACQRTEALTPCAAPLQGRWGVRALGRARYKHTPGAGQVSHYDGATPVLRAFLDSHLTRIRSMYRYTTGVV
jgi:hypothetical protein